MDLCSVRRSDPSCVLEAKIPHLVFHLALSPISKAFWYIYVPSHLGPFYVKQTLLLSLSVDTCLFCAVLAFSNPQGGDSI